MNNNLANIQFKIRPENSFTIDEQLAKNLAITLNRIKGKADLEISQHGELDINSFINFRINKRAKIIPNLNLFNETIETRGLTVYLVIDCSYSMERVEREVRRLTATIFKALEKCPFIDFKVLAYSGYNGITYLQEINKIDDVKYIGADGKHNYTPTYGALNYVAEKIKKSQDKKLIILITDGYPEDGKNSSSTLQDLTERSIINIKNQRVEFFTIFLNIHSGVSSVTERLRKMFKHGMYETRDLKDAEKIMIKKLSESVEKINQSG